MESTPKISTSSVSVVKNEMSTKNGESQEPLCPGDVKALILKAAEMKKYAYAPYSKFCVGAAILTPTGDVFTGCNVENASYSLTMCAEKVAIGKAVSEGFRKFRAIAVSTNNEDCVSPCGACRQAIREFGTCITIICANKHGEYKSYPMGEILPDSFCPEKLL